MSLPSKLKRFKKEVSSACPIVIFPDAASASTHRQGKTIVLREAIVLVGPEVYQPFRAAFEKDLETGVAYRENDQEGDRSETDTDQGKGEPDSGKDAAGGAD